uniref:(northern house mosquito) hypothetical protein n=1 Tax=Culex pipiens TaxID=7175 RepID=A0A8D8K5W1_CULPI
MRFFGGCFGAFGVRRKERLWESTRDQPEDVSGLVALNNGKKVAAIKLDAVNHLPRRCVPSTRPSSWSGSTGSRNWASASCPKVVPVCRRSAPASSTPRIKLNSRPQHF